MSTKPTHAFMLDMIKATLYRNLWPDFGKGAYHRFLSIEGNQERRKTFGFKVFKPVNHVVIAFLIHIEMANDLLSEHTHQANQAALFMKISGITDDEEVLRKIERF